MKNGEAIYDKLAENYGAKDIIDNHLRDIILKHPANARAHILKRKAIREISKMIGLFNEYNSFVKNETEEQPIPWVQYTKTMCSRNIYKEYVEEDTGVYRGYYTNKYDDEEYY